MDNGINETDRVIYTVGPGLRMAIIFVSFIVTLTVGFAAGHYNATNKIIGADKANQVEVLKSDTKVGLRLVEDYIKKKDKLREARKGREYDKTCGDMLISDIIK